MSASSDAKPAPSVAEVERIAQINDPVLRNLQITQCYADLSLALAARTGMSANWCTFATWASKQAGQSIRKEDLLVTFERELQGDSYAQQAAERVANETLLLGAARSLDETRTAVFKSLNLRLAVDRTSEAVGRGNQKVFAEIGREFARFLAEFLDDPAPNGARLERFCTSLQPGEPPEGQRYLRQAFRRYYQAFFEEDARQRSELLLCANIEIGLHEQTRLQPEIAEAMNAGLVNIAAFTRALLAASFPLAGRLAPALWIGRRLLGRPTAFELAAQVLLAAAQRQVRMALTETMMTIRFPPGVVIRLGDDLTSSFPQHLRHLTDPELCALVAQFGPSPDTLAGSGTRDWANLPDRLRFIMDLFRCYQETGDLFDAPFSPSQLAALRAGRTPDGQL